MNDYNNAGGSNSGSYNCKICGKRVLDCTCSKPSIGEYSSVHKVEEEYTIEKIVENHYEQALQDFFKVFNAELSDLSIEIKTLDGLTCRMSYKENQLRLEEE